MHHAPQFIVSICSYAFKILILLPICAILDSCCNILLNVCRHAVLALSLVFTKNGLVATLNPFYKSCPLLPLHRKRVSQILFLDTTSKMLIFFRVLICLLFFWGAPNQQERLHVIHTGSH